MSTAKNLKKLNSKGHLAKAIVMYQRALQYYARDDHWAVKPQFGGSSTYTWICEDDPMMVANTVLGIKKPDPAVRQPDNQQATPKEG